MVKELEEILTKDVKEHILQNISGETKEDVFEYLNKVSMKNTKEYCSMEKALEKNYSLKFLNDYLIFIISAVVTDIRDCLMNEVN